jgi:Spy/CpxP family protein refolding chaperone
MRHFRIERFFAALLLISVCLPALAGDRLAVVTTDRPSDRHRGFAHVRECLSILELSDQQKEEIRAILDAARPGIQADASTVRASREKLRADAGAPAVDACLVGQDFLALRQSLEILRARLQWVRGEVAAVLTSEQKAKLEGCLEAPRAESAAVDGEDEAEP